MICISRIIGNGIEEEMKILGLSGAIFLSAFSHSYGQDKIIRIASDPWCPFVCAQNSDKPGILIEVVKRVFEPEHRILTDLMPWSRVIEETRIGRAHIVIGALKSDVPDFVFPRESIVRQKSCFYVHPKSTWKFREIKDLKSVRLGGVQDYKYGEPVDEYIRNHLDSDQVDLMSGIDTGERLIKKLESSRVDVIIEDESVVRYLISRSKGTFEPKQAGCLKSEAIYLAFSPAPGQIEFSKKRSQLFDQKVRAMRSDGRLREILGSYGLR